MTNSVEPAKRSREFSGRSRTATRTFEVDGFEDIWAQFLLNDLPSFRGEKCSVKLGVGPLKPAYPQKW